MDYCLDEDIFTNDIHYFFSLHGPRFTYMSQAMSKSLSKRFGKVFKAIEIHNAWPSKKYSKPNYIVLNQKAYELRKALNSPVVYLSDYEDINVEFAQNAFIRDIATRLRKKQETIYIFPFTTSFLELSSSLFTVLGPSSVLAKKFDNKANQIKLFTKLGLPCVSAEIFNLQSVLEHKK